MDGMKCPQCPRHSLLNQYQTPPGETRVSPLPSAPHSFPSISVKEEQSWYTGLGSHLGYNLMIYFASMERKKGLKLAK